MFVQTTTTHASQPSSGLDTAVTDPVCGMAVTPYKAAAFHMHAGQSYYFCSVDCRDKFCDNPAQYLQPPRGKRRGVLAWLWRVLIGEKN